MGTLALIGLGGNVGDRRAHLEAALAALAGTPGVVVTAVSRYHETAPVGGPAGQGAFLNAAARLETDLTPPALLAALRAIEDRSGRVRSVRWGERPLDLDLLIHGSERLRTPELTLPHPRMSVRRFVLAPLAEVAPEAIDPATGRNVAGLLANLDRRPGRVALDLPAGPSRDELLRLIVAGLPPTGEDRWIVTGSPDGTLPPPTFVVRLEGPDDPRGPTGEVVLIPESDSIPAIAEEVLAACAASRP